MIEMLLQKRHLVILDDEDEGLLKSFRWYVIKTPKHYVVTGTTPHLYMHRLILPCPENKVIDHINGNSLDNRRKNLRIVSQRENTVNSKGWSAEKRIRACPYKGVWRISEKRITGRLGGRPYEAGIVINGKQRRLGAFKTMEEAAHAYDKAVRAFYPPTAYVNFPTLEAL